MGERTVEGKSPYTGRPRAVTVRASFSDKVRRICEIQFAQTGTTVEEAACSIGRAPQVLQDFMDGDGVSNTDEAGAGTDPLNPDTDGDGFTDAAELTAGSNPLDSSSTPAAAVPSGSVGSRLLLLALLLGVTQLGRGFPRR